MKWKESHPRKDIRPGRIRGQRVKAARALALLSFLIVSPTVWAGTRYEVKGEASVDAMPDVAKIFVLLRTDAADAASAMERVSAVTKDVVAKLKNAGVRDGDFTFDGEPSQAFPMHTPTGEASYGAAQAAFVAVQDFSILPKLTQILTDSGEKDWSVSYDFSDEARPLRLARAAALADATRKAEQYAKSQGLKGARLVDGKQARVCFPHVAGDLPYCETAGEKPAEREIVVTARKREGPRTDFSVPVPQSQTFTATVDATFELE